MLLNCLGLLKSDSKLYVMPDYPAIGRLVFLKTV